MKPVLRLFIFASISPVAQAGGWLSGGLFSRYDVGDDQQSIVDPRQLQSRPECDGTRCYVWGTCVTDAAGVSECKCLLEDGVIDNPNLPGTMGDQPGVYGCLDVDECNNDANSTNRCAPPELGGFCVDWDPPVKYQCGCLPGYNDRVFDSQFGAISCTDINECRDGVDGVSGIFPCSQDAICVNELGGFTCTCNDGFVGDGIDCAATDTPSPAPTDACTSDASCLAAQFGVGSFCDTDSGRCLCQAGYFSVNPGFTPCAFRDVCTTSQNPCDFPRATCTPNSNADDFADCECNPGFETVAGAEEGESCISSNACITSPQCVTVSDCPPNCSCTDGFCLCLPGFDCVDINVVTGNGNRRFLQQQEFLCTDDLATICANPPSAINCPAPVVTPSPTPAPTSLPARRMLVDLDEAGSLSDFIADDDRECTCVDCPEDKVCGGLWKGDAFGGDAHSFEKVHVVVSHCEHSMEWLNEYVSGYEDITTTITIFSKCGRDVEGAPASATIVRLSNVGRNDHTFANWMASTNYYELLDGDVAVVFLKDDLEHMHQSGTRRDFGEMLRVASKNKFACGVKPDSTQTVTSLSMYHESTLLRQFDLDEYMVGDYNVGDSSKFNSPYSNLGEWASSVGIEVQEPIAPVCYGGVFATTGSQITAKDQSMWAKLRTSLERGESIEEGHFVERMWASLLSPELTPSKVDAIVTYSSGIVEDGFGYTGTLSRTEGVIDG